MLYRIVEENYLDERVVFQESVTAHSLKDLTLSGVEHHCCLGLSYNRHICITEIGN
jgi:hypothetical protein